MRAVATLSGHGGPLRWSYIRPITITVPQCHHAFGTTWPGNGVHHTTYQPTCYNGNVGNTNSLSEEDRQHIIEATHIGKDYRLTQYATVGSVVPDT